MKSLKKLFGSTPTPSKPVKKKHSSSGARKHKLIEIEEEDDEEDPDEDEEVDDNSSMIVEVFENEKWHSTGWSFRNLLKSNDEWRYQSSAGGGSSFPSPPVPVGWMYTGHW